MIKYPVLLIPTGSDQKLVPIVSLIIPQRYGKKRRM